MCLGQYCTTIYLAQLRGHSRTIGCGDKFAELGHAGIGGGVIKRTIVLEEMNAVKHARRLLEDNLEIWFTNFE